MPVGTEQRRWTGERFDLTAAKGSTMGEYSITQRLAAEFLGTFWLVLAGCGSAVLASRCSHPVVIRAATASASSALRWRSG